MCTLLLTTNAGSSTHGCFCFPVWEQRPSWCLPTATYMVGAPLLNSSYSSCGHQSPHVSCAVQHLALSIHHLNSHFQQPWEAIIIIQFWRMRKLTHQAVKSLESWDVNLDSKPLSLSVGLTASSLTLQQINLIGCVLRTGGARYLGADLGS